jgi:hypothetical protein
VSALSDYAENKLLDHILRVAAFTQPAALYVALYTVAPSDSGGGTEVVGGSYARQSATFAAAVSGATSNTNALNYTNMPGVTVVAAAILDAVSAGNLLFHGSLTAPVVVSAGNSFNFAIGELDVTLA